MTYNPLAGYDPPDWLDDALCAQTGPDDYTWFPERGGITRTGKALCWTCPAREACLQMALDNDEPYGIFGGLSVTERRALRREAAA